MASKMFGVSRWLAVLCWIALSRAHIIITYPGMRGNNLHTNGTLPQLDADTIGINTYDNGTHGFPYGMQWMYPCTYLLQIMRCMEQDPLTR